MQLTNKAVIKKSLVAFVAIVTAVIVVQWDRSITFPQTTDQFRVFVGQVFGGLFRFEVLGVIGLLTVWMANKIRQYESVRRDRDLQKERRFQLRGILWLLYDAKELKPLLSIAIRGKAKAKQALEGELEKVTGGGEHSDEKHRALVMAHDQAAAAVDRFEAVIAEFDADAAKKTKAA